MKKGGPKNAPTPSFSRFSKGSKGSRSNMATKKGMAKMRGGGMAKKKRVKKK